MLYGMTYNALRISIKYKLQSNFYELWHLFSSFWLIERQRASIKINKKNVSSSLSFRKEEIRINCYKTNYSANEGYNETLPVNILSCPVAWYLYFTMSITWNNSTKFSGVKREAFISLQILLATWIDWVSFITIIDMHLYQIIKKYKLKYHYSANSWIG